MIFHERPESWPSFNEALYQLLNGEGYGRVVEGSNVFCAMLHAGSAKAVESTVPSGKGTVSTSVADYINFKKISNGVGKRFGNDNYTA